jgi:hypothetical protein
LFCFWRQFRLKTDLGIYWLSAGLPKDRRKYSVEKEKKKTGAEKSVKFQRIKKGEEKSRTNDVGIWFYFPERQQAPIVNNDMSAEPSSYPFDIHARLCIQ